jgi:hypothetical protein
MVGAAADQMDHLACFSGGMFGLAAHEEKDDNSARWVAYVLVQQQTNRVFEKKKCFCLLQNKPDEV